MKNSKQTKLKNMNTKQNIQSQPIQSNEFFERIKGLKPCLLLGNGICLHLNKHTLKWNELLMQLMNDLFQRGNLQIPFDKTVYEQYLRKVNNPDVANYPECYTSLLVSTRQHKKDDPLKSKIKALLCQHSETSCPLLDYAKENDLQILTTNFDFKIEQALGFCDDFPLLRRTTKGKETYALYDIFGQSIPRQKKLVFENNKEIDNSYIISDHCTVWHIHGHCNRTKTILLGLEDYIDSIIYVKDNILKLKGVPKGFREPWENDFQGMNTWLRPFFTQPLVIAGLTIGSGEVFLRWLLLRRARAQFDGKINLPPVYYLDTDGQTEGTIYRNEYFKMLNIQVVSFNDYDDLYDNAAWKDLVENKGNSIRNKANRKDTQNK